MKNKSNKIYVISRIYKPLYIAIKKKKWIHTGSPAYYNFIKYLNTDLRFNSEIIFLLDSNSVNLVDSNIINIKGIDNPIRIINYKNFYKGNLKFFKKMELVFNKIFQFFQIFFYVKKKSIYYIDRDNIALGNLLKYKKGLVVYRLLGITEKIYKILFLRKGFINLIFMAAIKIKNSMIISTNDGSWNYEVKRRLKSENFYTLFNGHDKVLIKSKKEYNKIFIISYVSRLEQGKGHNDFLFFIKSLILNNINNIKIFIVGGGALYQELIKLSKKLNIDNIVNFTGEIEHKKVSTYLNNSDLFITFNYFGVFGNNLIEATANGLPIITLDNFKIPQEFKKNFILLNQNDLKSGVKLVKKLIDDEKFKKKYSKLSQDFYKKNISTWLKRIEFELNLIKKEYEKYE